MHGRIAVKIAEQENDCEDTTEDLEESKKFFADLEVKCKHTTNKFGRVWHYDANGMLAVADTIRILESLFAVLHGLFAWLLMVMILQRRSAQSG